MASRFSASARPITQGAFFGHCRMLSAWERSFRGDPICVRTHRRCCIRPWGLCEFLDRVHAASDASRVRARAGMQAPRPCLRGTVRSGEPQRRICRRPANGGVALHISVRAWQGRRTRAASADHGQNANVPGEKRSPWRIQALFSLSSSFSSSVSSSFSFLLVLGLVRCARSPEHVRTSGREERCWRGRGARRVGIARPSLLFNCPLLRKYGLMSGPTLQPWTPVGCCRFAARSPTSARARLVYARWDWALGVGTVPGTGNTGPKADRWDARCGSPRRLLKLPAHGFMHHVRETAAGPK